MGIHRIFFCTNSGFGTERLCRLDKYRYFGQKLCMKIKVLAIARTEEAYLREGIELYLNRIKHYLPFEYVEVSDKKIAKKITAEQQKQREAEIILPMLGSADELYLFDEGGREFDSVGFSDFLQKKMNAGTKTLVLLIGGPYGFSDLLYDRAIGKLSLSRMTFSHQMVRLFALEQVYRALTIIKGEPYHHQ